MKKDLYALSDEKHIGEPLGGWKPKTLYLVNIAMNSHNPIFHAILYSGLDVDIMHSHYATIWLPNSKKHIPIEDLWYLEPVRDLDVNMWDDK